jgi:hypothetical protein
MICTRTAWNSGIHFLLRKTQVLLNSDTALRAYPVGEMTACSFPKVVTVSWGETPCSLIDRSQSFGGTRCLYLQSRSASIQKSAVENFGTTWLHGVTSKKTVVLRVTAVRTQRLLEEKFVL